MNTPNPQALTANDFRAALYGLLPRGKAWPAKQGQSTVSQRIWLNVATFLMRFHRAAINLLVNEAFPGTASQLMADWERALGLPDPCVTGSLTLVQRQAAAVARLAGAFDPTEANFIAFAAALGFTITITYPSANVWEVHAAAVSVTYFRAGNSVAGDPLSSFTPNTLLECSFRARCPAHTRLVFAYDL